MAVFRVETFFSLPTATKIMMRMGIPLIREKHKEEFFVSSINDFVSKTV